MAFLLFVDLCMIMRMIVASFQHVGCDGYLKSQVKEDNCRVCAGDNSTCKTISGLFSKLLPKGGR